MTTLIGYKEKSKMGLIFFEGRFQLLEPSNLPLAGTFEDLDYFITYGIDNLYSVYEGKSGKYIPASHFVSDKMRSLKTGMRLPEILTELGLAIIREM